MGLMEMVLSSTNDEERRRMVVIGSYTPLTSIRKARLKVVGCSNEECEEWLDMGRI